MDDFLGTFEIEDVLILSTEELIALCKKQRKEVKKLIKGNIEDCIICKQDNMMLGDSLDGLNKQIQLKVKDNGPFNVTIILERVK